tara:strand:- start:1194 stop:1607 length:414 start_codon:yes stop_codon:yes gene_type:complete
MKKLDGSTMYEYLGSYDERQAKVGAVKEGDWAHYQQQSLKTALAVKCDHPVIYPTLGLANEAGEVAGKIKKIFRDKEGKITDEDRSALKYELGDVLWYLSQVCTALDIDLADVASSNLKKLFSRKARGELQGDGDKR